MWCYPTSCGVFRSESRRFPTALAMGAEQCLTPVLAQGKEMDRYWCQRVEGPPPLNYTPKGDSSLSRGGRMDLHATIIAGCLQSSCPLTKRREFPTEVHTTRSAQAA